MKLQAETTIEDAFKTIVNDCKSKEQASDADAAIVMNHEVPNSSSEKCLFACFYETIGVVKSIFFGRLHPTANLFS